MKEDKTKFINKLKNETEDNQKLACSCGCYGCDRAFLMGFYNYTSNNDWWEKIINYYWEKWVISCHYKGTDSWKQETKAHLQSALDLLRCCCQIRYISEKKTTCTLPSIPPFNNKNNKVGVTVITYRLLELRHNIAARDVLPGGMSVPKQQKFHTHDVKSMFT